MDSHGYVVRNTFLDLPADLDPEMPPMLERSKTAPAASNRAFDNDESSAGEDDSPRGEEDDAPAPRGLPLERVKTMDRYEDANHWSWEELDSDPASSSQPAVPLSMQQPAMPMQPGQQPPMAMQPMQHPPVMYQAGPGMMPMQPMQHAFMMVPVVMPAAGMQHTGVMPTGPAPGGNMMPPPGGYQQPSASMPAVPDTTPTNSGSWPPPPPDQLPGIERVPSGSGPAPQHSPTTGNQQRCFAAAGLDNKAAAASAAPLPSSGSAPAASSTAAPPQPQTLTRAVSMKSNRHRIHWYVDARKLKGNDKQAVSPPFGLSFGNDLGEVTFKMMIYPKVTSENKGGASFKKAKGTGYVQLKCEAELTQAEGQVNFRFGIGRMDTPETFSRGPVTHNFAQSAVCGLPKDMEDWDFTKAVEQESITFVVVLEIVSDVAGH